jgi:hypothetical protein
MPTHMNLGSHRLHKGHDPAVDSLIKDLCGDDLFKRGRSNQKVVRPFERGRDPARSAAAGGPGRIKTPYGVLKGVGAAAARLVGTDRRRIVAEASRLLRDPAAHAEMATAISPYGDGMAARQIVSILLER